MLKLSKDYMLWCLSSLKSQVVVKCLLTRNADGDITGCPDPFLGGRYSGSGAVLIVFYISSGSITRKPRPSRWPECTASSARRCSSPIRWVWLSTRTMQQLGTGTKELLLIVVVELISRIINLNFSGYLYRFRARFMIISVKWFGWNIRRIWLYHKTRCWN